MNRDHTIINALNESLPTSQPTYTALKRPTAAGPYYLKANSYSTSSSTSAGLSTTPFAIGESTITTSVYFLELQFVPLAQFRFRTP